ncbi:hypothetical protein MPER_04358, partial [Moniliophthora perniciosa FA553]
MGPGHRRDTIDDHLGAWNWTKIIRLGSLLWKRRRTAEKEQKKQNMELAEFSEGLEDSVLAEWWREVDDWEQGRSQQNPYTTPTSGKTEQDVRLEYAEKEARDQQLGILSLYDVTPSAFLKLGLDIEEHQKRSWPRADHQKEEDLGAEAVATWVAMEIDFLRAQLTSALNGVRNHLFIRTRLNILRSLHTRHQRDSTRARTSLANNDRKIEGHKMKYRMAWDALKNM